MIMKAIYFKMFLFLVVILSFGSCDNHTKTLTNDAIISSYIIEYRTTVEQGNLKSLSHMTQWVDNEHKRYAVLTNTETDIAGRKLAGKSLMINIDGWSYVLNLDDRSGFRSKTNQDEKLVSGYLKPAETAKLREMVEEDNGRIVGEEQILGRSCKVVELPEMDESGRKTLTKIWYYRGIPLKIINQLSVMEAITFEENITIPSENFEVPEGIEVKTIPSL